MCRRKAAKHICGYENAKTPIIHGSCVLRLELLLPASESCVEDVAGNLLMKVPIFRMAGSITKT